MIALDGWLRLAVAAVLAATVQACVTTKPGGDAPGGHRGAPALVIDGIVIRNELAYPATDVMIEVPATGAFAGCGNVLPRTACSNTFEGVDYRSNAVLVRWRERGLQHSTGEFVIEIPDGMQPGKPAFIEVVIFAPGEAGARLLQR